MKSPAKKKNFHIPLPDETYTELRRAAQNINRPATQIARDAIEHWLREQKKQSLKNAITTYAHEHAGTPLDLDHELEAASTEQLFQTPRKKKKRL